MADPIIGKISVGDGATFTPAVSSTGVLSWSNNKALENPDDYDLPAEVLNRAGSMGLATEDWVSSQLSNYLPLSGGTMTGTISLSATNMLVGTADDQLYRIAGATTASNGAHLVLTGNNYTANPGAFTLRVNNENVDIRLTGKPDGTLTWNNNNIITSAGGTMTGELILPNGGKALSDATVGNLITNTANSVAIPQTTAKTLSSITLPAGTWIITGHMYINGSNVIADKLYALGIGATANNVAYGEDGTIATHSAFNSNIVLQTTRIYDVAQQTTIYMCVLSTAATTVSSATIRAIRIK